MRYTFEQFKELLRSVGFPESVLDTMAAIGLAESSGDPYVLRDCPGSGVCRIVRGGRVQFVPEVRGQGPETSVGLFQVNRRAHPQYSETALYNPVANARAALEIFQKQGLRAWGSYVDGNYKQHLPAGASDPGAGSGALFSPFGTGGVAGSVVEWLTGRLNRPVDDAGTRFSPYLGQSAASGTQRFQIAAVIALVVIAFAWREFS